MTRDEAVQRINQGVGFRPAGNPLEPAIILMLQEAQRDLEHGKTLPQFLLVPFSFTLPKGTNVFPLPDGFIRESDDTRLRLPIQTGIRKPIFLDRRYFIDGAQARLEEGRLEQPSIYAIDIAGSRFIFFNLTDRDYLISFQYYKADAILTSNIENRWLKNAPEWLIGEAGWRLAMDMRDADAVTKFDAIRKSGRAASFGEDLTAELASGPLEMGANL